jgi:hypothetical protein
MANDTASTANKNFLDAFPLCHNSCHQKIIYALWLFLILLPFYQYYYFQLDFAQWDLLLFTGIMTFIFGLNLVADLNQRFNLTLKRLLIRRIIKFEGEEEWFFDRLEKHAQYCARIGGIIVAFAILCAFSIVLINNFFWQRVLLGVIESFGGYIAGTYLGRMVSYGQLGWQLKKEAVKIEVQPSHVDGVAGLKPIGDFFFHQAMILAIPAIFLAVWWLLFPIWPRDYSYWENIYLLLLSIAIFIEILAFFVPVWSFHRIMVSEKEKWLKRADKLSNEINEIQSVLDSDRPWEAQNIQHEQVEMMRQCYWSIENMTTWPVDTKTRSKFRLNNLLLFIPLLGDVAKRTFDWKHIVSIFK